MRTDATCGSVFTYPCIVGYLMCAIRSLQMEKVAALSGALVAERAARNMEADGYITMHSRQTLKLFAEEFMRFLWGSPE